MKKYLKVARAVNVAYKFRIKSHNQRALWQCDSKKNSSLNRHINRNKMGGRRKKLGNSM